jgi:WD40 repeat protein
MVFSASFTPDGHTLVSGGDDRMVRLWDVASCSCTATMTVHTKCRPLCGGLSQSTRPDDGIPNVKPAPVFRSSWSGHVRSTICSQSIFGLRCHSWSVVSALRRPSCPRDQRTCSNSCSGSLLVSKSFRVVVFCFISFSQPTRNKYVLHARYVRQRVRRPPPVAGFTRRAN